MEADAAVAAAPLCERRQKMRKATRHHIDGYATGAAPVVELPSAVGSSVLQDGAPQPYSPAAAQPGRRSDSPMAPRALPRALLLLAAALAAATIFASVGADPAAKDFGAGLGTPLRE